MMRAPDKNPTETGMFHRNFCGNLKHAEERFGISMTVSGELARFGF
jgi:hypothetical protein